MNSHYEKKRIFLNGFLQGKGFFNALKAEAFAAKYHTGLRRDKKTAEFEHQISQACYAMTILDSLMFPEETICTIFLHDVREDYNVTHAEILAIFPDQEFAERVADAVEKMTKEFNGVKKDTKAYFDALGECPIGSIAKGIDRFHNFSSMNNAKADGNPVFSYEKQANYSQEGKDYFLPMMKVARYKFPEQFLAIMNVTTMLKTQLELLDAIQKAAKL